VIRVGCSGWNYASWRDDFYPPRTPASRWLEHYASVFDTVEVNSTFYRLARKDAVQRWVYEQTPQDFLFTIKASRYLTHIRRLQDMGQGVERLYEPLEPLVESGKLGPVLWQLPGNFHRDDERLAFALEHLPPGRHTFEFRHASWFCEPVYELLRAHDVALTIPDRKGVEFPHVFTAGWTFVRFHFGHRGRRGNYSQGELREWAERIAEWSCERDVYAYFNNDWEIFAPRNAVDLRRMVRKLVEPSQTVHDRDV
jgi:uncharacterized protein YecE (DUF72 family)